MSPSVITEVVKVEKGFATSSSDDSKKKTPDTSVKKDSVNTPGIIIPDYEEGESYTF